MNYPRYPEYKPSGVEWLGEVPGHWEVKRLRFVAEINPTKSEINELSEDTPVSFVPMDAVGEYGGLSLEAEKILDEVKNGYTYFADGDVVLAKITPCFENGKGALADGLLNGVGFGTTELHVLRPTPALDRRFLFYLSIAYPFRKIGEFEMYGAGGQKRVPEEFIKDFRPGLPSVEEQRAIAAFLDRETARIDALIEKKRRFIELLQEKRAALISRAVTRGLDPNVPLKDSGVEWLGQIPAHWEVKSIKRTCLVKRGASPRPIDDPIYFDDNGECSWVRISDVTSSDRYLEKTEQRLSELGESLSVRLESGELFLSIAGSVGKPIITKIKCCIHDGFVYFWQYKNDPEFLYYVFASGRPYQGLGKLGTQLNLNTDTVGDIKVGWPPLDEQGAIATFLDRETAKLDALRAKVETAIEKLKEYRAALIAAAVTGKIDVREA